MKTDPRRRSSMRATIHRCLIYALGLAAATTLFLSVMGSIDKRAPCRYAAGPFSVGWRNERLALYYHRSDTRHVSVYFDGSRIRCSIHMLLDPPRRLRERRLQTAGLGIIVRNGRVVRGGFVPCRVQILAYSPAWVPVALFAFYPMFVFVRGPLRRWRRDREGLCVKCGYNLTGNVSGICPECGRPIEKPPE